MNQIQNLYIKGYRGIQDLELNQLGQINLIIGQNNVGKTSILESIELLSKPGNLSQFISTSRSRDRMIMTPSRNKLSLLDYVLWTFPIKHGSSFKEIIRGKINLKASITVNNIEHQDIEYKIEHRESLSPPSHDNSSILLSNKGREKNWDIEGYDLNLEEYEDIRALELLFHIQEEDSTQEEKFIITDNIRNIRVYYENSRSLFKTRLVSPVDHRLLPVSATFITQSIMSGEENSIIKLLQEFDQDIESIDILSPQIDSTVPYFKHRTMGFVPVNVYGDGVRRILTIAAAITRARNGLLLIDEVETAIHSKLFKKFFNWLVTNCKEYNIQLFITTHSLEAIDAILSADKENLNELTTYRLEKSIDGEKTIAKRFMGDDMYSLRYELGQDVR